MWSKRGVGVRSFRGDGEREEGGGGRGGGGGGRWWGGGGVGRGGGGAGPAARVCGSAPSPRPHSPRPLLHSPPRLLGPTMADEGTYVIAAGKTGGHIYPGIALAREIRARRPEAPILFVGTAGGLEERLVPEAGFALERVAA